MTNEAQILSNKFKKISPYLDERTLRIWVATESLNLKYGGVSMLSEITGLSRPTIYSGIEELKKRKTKNFIEEINRARKSGGGRKKITEKNIALQNDLERLIDPVTRGDPMNPLRWTSKSTYNLADELNKMGHAVSQRTVYNLLDEMHYSMQSNRKKKKVLSIRIVTHNFNIFQRKC